MSKHDDSLNDNGVIEDDDARMQRIMEAGNVVSDALVKLYAACDGDEAAVGEILYELDQGARIESWSPVDPDRWREGMRTVIRSADSA